MLLLQLGGLIESLLVLCGGSDFANGIARDGSRFVSEGIAHEGQDIGYFVIAEHFERSHGDGPGVFHTLDLNGADEATQG